MSEHFPFSSAGAALLCSWIDDDYGPEHIRWTNIPDERKTFSATVGLVDHHNVLRFGETADMDQRFAEAAAQAVNECLRERGLTLPDIDAIVAAPARSGYRAALATRLGVPVERVTVARDDRMHTAALAAAFDHEIDRVGSGDHVLLVAAGAGITAGAGLYRAPAVGPPHR